jgi:hypothetical protein
LSCLYTERVEDWKNPEEKETFKQHVENIALAAQRLDDISNKPGYSVEENELCKRNHAIIEWFLDNWTLAMLKAAQNNVRAEKERIQQKNRTYATTHSGSHRRREKKNPRSN